MNRRKIAGLCAFFLVTFGIPWLGWTLLKDSFLPYWVLPLGCSLGGFVASFVEGGFPKLRSFTRRTTRFNLNIIGILIATFLIPLFIGFVFLFVEGSFPVQIQWQPVAGFYSTLAMALLTGPIDEEFAWRGYLQPSLMKHLRPIYVALTITIIWYLWHLPLYYNSVFSSVSPLSDFLYILQLCRYF